MTPDRYVRGFDNRTERLVNPQEWARIFGGKAVTHTGYILPYGRGGYRHSFGGCCGFGCQGGCGGDCGCGSGGLGAEGEQGLPFMAWVLLLGLGGALAYTLLRVPRT